MSGGAQKLVAPVMVLAGAATIAWSAIVMDGDSVALVKNSVTTGDATRKVLAMWQPQWPMFGFFNVLACVFVMKASDFSLQRRVLAYQATMNSILGGFVLWANNDADKYSDIVVVYGLAAMYAYVALDGELSVNAFRRVFFGGAGITAARKGPKMVQYAQLAIAASFLFLGLTAVFSPASFFENWKISTKGLEQDLLVSTTRWYGMMVASVGTVLASMASHGSVEALTDATHFNVLVVAAFVAMIPHLGRNIAGMNGGSDQAVSMLWKVTAVRAALIAYSIYALRQSDGGDRGRASKSPSRRR